MKRFCLVLPAAFLLAALAAPVQQQSPRGPDGGTNVRVGGVGLLPISGEPLSADTRIDWTETLADGTVVTKHLDGHLARDSQGRIYREGLTFATGESQSRLQLMVFFDPVAGTRTVCVVATRHCAMSAYHPPTAFFTQPVGVFDGSRRYLARETLGPNTIQGIDVVGTRETTTINAGVLGNNQPLVSTREYWYSPELQTNLLVTRKSPQQGTQVIQLLNISRADPPPERFQPPAGFLVQDNRQAPRSASGASIVIPPDVAR